MSEFRLPFACREPRSTRSRNMRPPGRGHLGDDERTDPARSQGGVRGLDRRLVANPGWSSENDGLVNARGRCLSEVHCTACSGSQESVAWSFNSCCCMAG